MTKATTSDDKNEWTVPGENYARECVNYECSEAVDERTLRCDDGHAQPATAEQERLAWESDQCHCPPSDQLVIGGSDDCFVCGGEIA